ncbi:MAG TPA: hypothetical protein O0Y17_00890, partial [Methanocorpusculum sp.]|nr:hypothetical protein [Methanocorpusculum sp.]
MNKLIVAAEVAAVLLIAVICTAGCFGISGDITGTYMAAGDDTSATFVVFEEGGSGYFIELAETEEPAAAVDIPFTWTAVEPKKTYTLVFTDGTTKAASLDKQRGLLIIDEVTYTETMNPFSGKYPPGDVGGQSEPKIGHSTPGPQWSA